jgi:hypothetical protein
MKPKDIKIALKRKKLWDYFGWHYKGFGFLAQNHSLNCGCSFCIANTKHRRYENKKKRLKDKLNLKNYIE